MLGRAEGSDLRRDDLAGGRAGVVQELVDLVASDVVDDPADGSHVPEPGGTRIAGGLAVRAEHYGLHDAADPALGDQPPSHDRRAHAEVLGEADREEAPGLRMGPPRRVQLVERGHADLSTNVSLPARIARIARSARSCGTAAMQMDVDAVIREDGVAVRLRHVRVLRLDRLDENRDRCLRPARSRSNRSAQRPTGDVPALQKQ